MKAPAQRLNPPRAGFFLPGAGWLHGIKPFIAGYTVATQWLQDPAKEKARYLLIADFSVSTWSPLQNTRSPHECWCSGVITDTQNSQFEFQ